MGLTERHWFENEDVPEKYEWELEDAVCNPRTNKKHDDDIVRCRDCVYATLIFEPGMLPYIKCCGVDHDLDWFCADGKRR